MNFDLLWISARRDSADNVEPVLLRKIDDAARAVDERLIRNRNPERGRVLKSIAKEGRWGDSHNRERLTVQCEASTDNRPVATVLLLPGTITDDRCRIGALTVILRR